MMTQRHLTVSASVRILRPIDIVRRQFADVQHHARNQVHHGVSFIFISETEGEVRYRLEERVFGIGQVDEVVLRREANGTITNEFVSGSNAGTKLISQFEAEGPNSTIAKVTVQFPLRGLYRFLRPLVRLVVLRKLAKGLEEDRRDLEEGTY